MTKIDVFEESSQVFMHIQIVLNIPCQFLHTHWQQLPLTSMWISWALGSWLLCY